MTTLLLMRHGSIDELGVRLMGRRTGVHLNEMGRREAAACSEALVKLGIQRICSSPLERARETAKYTAKRLGIACETLAELNEVDFGDWTGETFATLNGLPSWREFNQRRCQTMIPGGENMRGFAARVGSALHKLRDDLGNGLLLVVTHAEWIRTAAAVCLNLSLDTVMHFQVLPASISILRFDSNSTSLLGWNCKTISAQQLSGS
jgi:broad specificity phosphatase PhoE